MEANIQTDVVIVGAGPTGLSLAAQLMRYGVNFVIIDKKGGITDLSKALAVHARTLEIYDQLGLAQRAVEEGAIAQNLVLMHDGKVRATLDFGNVGGHLSPFPFVLIFEQRKNERLLESYLQDGGIAVRWNTAIASLTQDEAGVQAVLQGADGQTQTVEARYLVGCDGASSTTRHLLDLGFEGSTYPRIFYVADVDADFGGERDSIHASFEENAFLLLFPMQGENHWRLIGPLPEYEETSQASAGQEVKVTFEQIEDKVKATIKRPFTIQHVRWFSAYKVHTRHAATFAKGRCFLAGDAAHVHTPAGGQGMNTGIQDAYNLAWKLAFVLKHGADESLLDTYNEERLTNAKQLLQTTDQFFEVAAGDTWYQRLFRDTILPPLANFAWRFDAVKEVVFPTLSQIGIHYAESPLSQHEGDTGFKVKAGDRMPYFQVQHASIYDQLHAPTFHLLCFSNDENDFAQQRTYVKDTFGALVDVHALPLYPHAAELFGANQPFCVLLRPDNYIAFVARTLSEQEVDAYFSTVVL